MSRRRSPWKLSTTMGTPRALWVIQSPKHPGIPVAAHGGSSSGPRAPNVARRACVPIAARAYLLRSVPPADRFDELVGFLGAPRPRLVLEQVARTIDDGVDDLPRGFDGVLPCKE